MLASRDMALLSSPSGPSWLLCLTFPLFPSSVARFVPSLAVSVSSAKSILQPRAAFIPHQEINSSINSLRNSWEVSDLVPYIDDYSCVRAVLEFKFRQLEQQAEEKSKAKTEE
jgi:hypothetical protein